jgi:hypothetical protein
MTALDQLIPRPHVLELDRVRVPAPAEAVWEKVRHGELAQARPIRALFTLRSLMMRDRTGASPTIRIDDLRSSTDRPGFQILRDDPPRELAVGAIGKVWRLRIPFVHVSSAHDYAAFTRPGFVKVAWAIRVMPFDADTCHIEVEVRVHATDTQSWRKCRCYFWLIGPFSRYIRRSLLKTIARESYSRVEGGFSSPEHHHIAGLRGG